MEQQEPSTPNLPEDKKTSFWRKLWNGIHRTLAAAGHGVVRGLRALYAVTQLAVRWIGKCAVFVGGRTKVAAQWLFARLKKRKIQKALGISVGVILTLVLIADYWFTLRVDSITTTTELNARGGKIVIKYTAPSQQINYFPESKDLQVSSELSKDGLTETHTLLYPTLYKKDFRFNCRPQTEHYRLFGLFRLRFDLKISTGIESVAIKGLSPAEDSLPEPHNMGSRIAVQFQGEFDRFYLENRNLQAKDLPYIKMTPEEPGYFRWTNRSELTFFFTEQKPKYDTQYRFVVDPSKLLDPKNQKWSGQRAEYAVRTSINDIHLKSFSFGKEIDHQETLKLEFSGDMVNVLATNARTLDPSDVPAQIEPTVEGTWRWVSTTQAEFQPKNGWPIRQHVGVKLRTELNREAGRVWRTGKSMAYAFYVKPIEQNILSTTLHQTVAELDAPLDIDFSHPVVDKTQLRIGIENTHDLKIVPVTIKPFIKGRFYWIKPNVLRFKPDPFWKELTKYRAEINSEYKFEERYAWTSKPNFAEFTTVENLVKVSYHFTPEQKLKLSEFNAHLSNYQFQKKPVRPEYRLWIRFSRNLGQYFDKRKPTQSVLVTEPAIAARITWIDPYTVEYAPTEAWKPNTHYTIQLSKDLLYAADQHFAKDEDRLQFSSDDKWIDVLNSSGPGSNLNGQLEFKFSKKVNPKQNIGQVYPWATLDPTKNPLLMEPKVDAKLFWKDASTLVLEPTTRWPQKTKFRFSLNETAFLDNEWKLRERKPFEETTPENWLTYTVAAPKARKGADARIEVLFNQIVRPPQIAIGQATTVDTLRLEPPIQGKWYWESDEKIVFEPAQELPAATEYQIAFNPNKLDFSKYSWNGARESKLAFAKYKEAIVEFSSSVLATHFSNSENQIDENGYLREKFSFRVSLSDAVDPNEFKKHFALTYEEQNSKSPDGAETTVQGVTYTLKSDTSGPSKSLSIETDWIKRPLKKRLLQAKLSNELQPVGSNMSFPENSFNINQAALKYIQIKNVNWNHEHDKTWAHLMLSSPVMKERLEKHLRVDQILGTKKKPNYLPVTYTLVPQADTSYRVEFAKKITPGQNYRFVLEKGLFAVDGSFVLEATVFDSSVFPYEPQLKFALSGNVVSIKDMQHIPLYVQNQAEINLQVFQVFSNNINFYLNHINTAGGEESKSKLKSVAQVGKMIFTRDYKVQDLVKTDKVDANKLDISIDLSPLLKKNPHGLYYIVLNQVSRKEKGKQTEAKSHDDTETTETTETTAESTAEGVASKDSSVRYTLSDFRWFNATDIGLRAHYYQEAEENKILLWATSLQTGDTSQGVNVRVYDAWNQVISTATTDNNGVAMLALPPKSIPTHALAIQGKEFSFVNFKAHKIEHDGKQIEGLQFKSDQLKAFLYTSRGVYRPGETLNLVSVIRDQDENYPINYPAELKIFSPDSKEMLAHKFRIAANGLLAHDFQIPAGALSGNWSAKIFWRKQEIGQYGFQVEEFIPNKIDVKIKAPESQLLTLEPLKFSVSAEHKFGGVAAGLKVTTRIDLQKHQQQGVPGYEQYQFGAPSAILNSKPHEFGEQTLSPLGTVDYAYDWPQGIPLSHNLVANLATTVIDDAGRGVAQYKAIILYAFTRYVGIKRLGDDAPQIKHPVRFNVVNVSQDGKPVARDAQKIEVKVIHYQPLAYYKKNERGYYRFVTEEVAKVWKELGDPTDSHNNFEILPDKTGRYEVVVSDLVGKQISHFSFEIGADEMEAKLATGQVHLKVQSSTLDLSDKLQLQVLAPFAGKLLLSIERDRIYHHQVLSVPKGKTVLDLPMRPEYFPNVFISATLVRAAKQTYTTDAIEARGLLKVSINDLKRKPNLKLEVANTLEPNTQVKATVSVDDPSARDMYFTLSAVDTGILDLTNFKLPSLERYFRAEYLLGVAHYSIYQLIVPFVPESKVRISPSGDEDAKAKDRRRQVNPDSQERVKPVALWSGLLRFNEQGQAQVQFDLPNFNGSLRFQAIAYGRKRYATKEVEVKVFDKLILRPGVPRFVAVGDELIVPVTVYNRLGGNKEINLSLQTSSHLVIQGAHSLKAVIADNSSALLNFRVKVLNKPGVADVQFTVSNEGFQREYKVRLPVRFTRQLEFVGQAGDIEKGTPRSMNVPRHLVDESVEFSMHLSPVRLAEFRNSLLYVLEYPHGCLEQFTSKMFPKIYFKDLAVEAGITNYPASKLKNTVQSGIVELQRMQRDTGDFAYWPGTDNYIDYAFVYAAHFIVEAKRAGFPVDTKKYHAMLKRLKATSSGFSAEEAHTTIYKLYVLALAGEKVLGPLNHIYDTQVDSLKPHELARLAAAYFWLDQKDSARSILRSASDLSYYEQTYRESENTFGTPARDLAIILDAQLLIDPDLARLQLLEEKIKGYARQGRFSSTQEDAVIFSSLAKYYRSKPAVVSGVIRFGDGQTQAFDGPVNLDRRAFQRGEIRVELKSDAKMFYSWSLAGVPKTRPALHEDKQIKVRRRYLDQNNIPLDVNKIQQGQIVVVELTLEALSQRVPNVAIVDLLPAGLEIENARLSTATKLAWIRGSLTADHEDVRDDRINLFSSAGSKAVHYYITRAVTAGTFTIPELRADAMYDPAIYSWSNTGRMRIFPKPVTPTTKPTDTRKVVSQ